MTMMRSLCVSALVCLTLTAHGATNVIAIAVRDAVGAPIRDASIRVTGQTPRLSVNATEVGPGEYSAPVPYGLYAIEVSAPGFKTVLQQVRVAGEGYRISIVMEPGPAGNTENRIALEPSSNLSATVVPADFLETLSDEQSEYETSVRQFAGPRPGTLDLVADGMPGGLFPQRDQIGEVWMDGNRFTAEFARRGPTLLEVLARPAGDALHATGTFVLQDESMNARPFFSGNKPSSQSRNVHGAVSGSLLEGRLPLSFSALRYRLDAHTAALRAVTPSAVINERVIRSEERHHYDTRGRYEASGRHTIAFNLEYGSRDIPVDGVGGVVLPERGHKDFAQQVEAGFREIARLSPNLTNVFRVQLNRDVNRETPLSSAVGIVVNDAFIGGGSPTNNRLAERVLQFNDHITWARRPVVVRSGIDLARNWFDQRSGASLQGAFTFLSLHDYCVATNYQGVNCQATKAIVDAAIATGSTPQADGRPITGVPSHFSQTSGAATTVWSQTEIGAYVQADWHMRPRLFVTGGVRAEAQSGLKDKNNWDPRISVAFALLPTLVIRGGAGTFHQRVSAQEAQAFLTSPGPRSALTILNPSFPDPSSAGIRLQNPITTSPKIVSSSLPLPYSIDTNLTVEKLISTNKVVFVSWEYARGVHLLRTRDINAPYPGTPLPLGLTPEQVNQLRPDSSTGPIFQTESTASSRFHALNVGYRLGFGRRVSLFGNYWLSSSYDDVGEIGRPSNNYDLRSDWGRSADFQRHYMRTGFHVRAPWRMTVAALVHARSGKPYDLRTGIDFNRDGFANDRPAGVARNSGLSAGIFTMDMYASKTVALPVSRLGEAATLSIFVYSPNVLNQTIRPSTIGVQTSPLFGSPAGALPNRRVEAGLRLTF